MTRRIISFIPIALLMFLAISQSAYASRSTVENGYLYIPRIDVDGYGALNLTFRIVFDTEYLLVLEDFIETSTAVSNSGVFDPIQSTIDVYEIELENGDVYWALLGLVSQSPQIIFRVLDAVKLANQFAPLLGRGDVYMPSRQADFFFSNGDSFSSTEIQNHMREKFNRYYTEPDWAPIRTIYVSPNGSQPIASNSASNPSSVNDAVNALAPGDLVHFLAGTYDNFNVRLWEDTAGTYDQPIVFYGARNSDQSLAVTLNCNTGGTSHTSSCFNLENSHYVAVDGFEMAGGKYGVRAVGGYANTQYVLGIAILNNDGHNQCSDPIFTGQASWLVVENNDTYDSGKCPTGNSDGHGVYLSNGGDFVIFRFNDIWGNLSSDFQINSDPISTCAGDLDTDAVCDGNAFNGFEGKGISEFYWIEGNYMHNGGAQGPNFTGVRNAVITRNVVAFMATHGVSFWQESDKTSPAGLNSDLASSHNLIEGNVFLNDPKQASGGGRHVLQIIKSANGNEFINNIIAGGRIVDGNAFVADNSVVLVEIDNLSADNTFAGNCVIGSSNFDEGSTAQWPRTLGVDWFTDIDPSWFANFPYDKMGSIEDWNVTASAPAGCPRLSFLPLQ